MAISASAKPAPEKRWSPATSRSRTRRSASRPPCSGAYGREGQSELFAGGCEFSFGGAVDEVVLHLDGDGCLLPPVVGDP